MFVEKIGDGKFVSFQSEPGDVPGGERGDVRLLSETFPVPNIADMYLYDRCPDSFHGISDTYGGVGVSAGVEDDACGYGVFALDTVYEFPFVVRLEITDFRLRKFFAQFHQKSIKSGITVYAGIPLSE